MSSSNSDLGSSSGSDYSDDDIKFGTFDVQEFNFRVNMGAKFCSCVEPIDNKSALALMIEMTNSMLVVENINCLLNNVITCCNHALNNFVNLNDPFRLAFADLFYKLRHEILFKALMLTLNLPSGKSDKPFNDLGIESNRTPDYIKIDGINLTVIEIATTSNFEKTAMMKGLQSSGYESKYAKEINMLREKGYIVNYIVFIFDMSSYNVETHRKLIKENSGEFHINQFYTSYLDLIYKEFCTITYNMKDYLFPVSTFLFTDLIPIDCNHSDLKQLLYDNQPFFPPYSYKKFTISSQVYNKISNLWHRILNIYENSNRDFIGSYIPILSLTSNRLRFEENTKGFDFEQIRDIIFTNDKPLFFQNLYLSAGNSKFLALGSETGVDFLERVDKVELIDDLNEKYNMPYLTSHIRVKVKRRTKGIIKKYKLIVNKVFNSCFFPKLFDPNYEELFISKIKEFDSISTNGTFSSDDFVANMNLGMLHENNLDLINIDSKMGEINLKYISNNDFNSSVPVKIQRMKQSFILPIANFQSQDYCSIKEKNIDFLTHIYNNLNDNNFTKAVFLKTLDDEFQFYIDAMQPSSSYLKRKNDKYEVCNQMTHLYKDYLNNEKKMGNSIKSCKLKDCKDDNIRNEYNNLRKEISRIDKDLDRMAKEEGIKRNIELIRLPTKNKKTILGNYFQSETSHFKSKENRIQSTIEGFGVPSSSIEFEYCCELVKDVGDLFTEYRGQNPDLLIDLQTFDDSNLLKELKTKTLNDYSGLINDIKDSYLGHSCSFISRMSHSLMYYSQMSFNSDYIRVDNLGYNNVVLLVRGGKKIFKSKSSKMFRILFPVSKEIVPFYIDDSIGPSNYSLIEFEGCGFLLSPWMMIHESILADSISFYPRVLSFCTLNSDPLVNFQKQIHKYLINVLLAFHNRRQTEVFLANMRYILLSTMGDYTGIMQIFDDFCGFNYDRFQFYIRTSIFKNYPDFFKKMRLVQKDSRSSESKFLELNVKNIFTGNVLDNTDSLTLMIYSTFLMTKGPYQRPAERAVNLVSILSIHSLFDEEVGLDKNPKDQLTQISVSITENQSFQSYCEELFRSDFNIDPKYISCLGVFANSFFMNLKMKDKMQTEWLKILNNEWDNLATSTGLRGRPEDIEDFWGKKGYFVVYKFLFKDPSYKVQMETLFNDDLDDNSKSKMLRLLNQTYLSKLNICEDKNLLFHAVDKVQWRGSREIYVMDMDTKIMQQPIEKMMAFICKNIDNELISIPTDKRAQVIHHSIFEKDLPLKDALTWFLTLDCSKWAPKSMFIKFGIMLCCMPILPPSFVCHFLNYTEKLFYKRIYFNVAEVKVLQNNTLYKEIVEKYLNFDEELNGYYLLMPYSWVMGIFNYTSSFMHAFNQKYAAYLINKTSSNNFSEETSLVMFAHSDDSGGRITSVNKNLIERGLMLYEIQLKCCNHLLSKKKSVVSKIYFEILSIIYIFKKLLALLPKFLGGLRFTPTDKGPGHDMLQSYSKCIEVMVAGADFSVAYLVMKFFSIMIWRFYYNKKPLLMDYLRPVQYFGIPDSHPLMVLLTGSDCDFLRLVSTKNTKIVNVIHGLINEMNLNFSDEGLIKPLKFNVKVRNIQKGFENDIERFKDVLESWTIGNVNFKRTPFNALNFLKKLNDPGFVGSLVNETPVRRISRSYYFRKGSSVITKKGNYTLNEIITAIRVSTDFALNGSDSNLEFIKSILGDDYLFKLENLLKQNDEDTPLMKVMRNVLSGPLKLHNYFDKLSLQGKDFRQIHRTLKPTQVQLLKTGSCFTNNFDAAQLVSYIKEPNFRWALPDLKNLPVAEIELSKLMSVLDLRVEDLDESSLLKLIRMHVTKTSKDIYLYSQIPGEIRNIKTYASMLVFLSTNSFKNIEINGLALKLKNSLTDPGYIETNINEDIYYLNSLCSIIIMIMKGKFKFNLSDLRIKNIDFIKWREGNLIEFINFISEKRYSIIDFEHIQLYTEFMKNYLITPDEISSKILVDKSYYVFLKEQKRRSGWYGSGQLLITVSNKFFILNLLGNNITSVESNFRGKLNPLISSFILEICKVCGINISPNYLKHNNKIETDLGFGYDHVNDLCVNEKREISRGVPFFILKRNPLFVNQLDFGTIKHLRENLFICDVKINEENHSYKVYGLKINKTNIIDTIKSLFYSEDFSKIMLEEGVEDLYEFILTELLTDFGEDITITKEEVFDLIFSSEIYKIFSEVKKTNQDVLPKTIKTARFPAEEGSLSRILLTYGETTKDHVIKNYKNYDPLMLSIRSEYPEGFSLILSEKMIECHRRLFDRDEDKEMLNAYVELSKIKNKDQLRQKLINLMCYWGYGSLVNAINIYDFTKKKSNYSIVKIVNSKSVSKGFYFKIFEQAIKNIIDCMISFSVDFESLEFPIKGLQDNLNLIKVINQYLKYLALSGYNYTEPINYLDLPNIYFINTLIAFLKNGDFCDRLTHLFSSHQMLNTLPIDYNFKKELVVFLNTLKCIYFIGNNINYKLNFQAIADRLPDNIPFPITIVKKFNNDVIKPKEMVYHHGFLSNYLISKFKTNIKILSGDKIYNIKQSISDLSDIPVSMNKVLPLIRPLNEEFLDSEEWDELGQELSFGDVDEETIMEIWENCNNQYSNRETHFKKNIINAKLKWVIIPYLEGKKSVSKFLRQIGENVAILTTSLMNMSDFPNSYSFLTNFSEIAGTNTPDVMVHVFGNKALNKQFWCDLLGENEIHLHQEQLEPLYLKNVNTESGISDTSNLGAIKSEDLLTENYDNLIRRIELKDVDETEEVDITDRRKSEKNEIDASLEKAINEGLIDDKVAEKLRSKYYSYNTSTHLSLNDLLKSMLEEIDLNFLNKIFLETLDQGLTKKQLIKIYQTPEHFGLSQSTDRTDNNPILNSKLRAELESFCSGLSVKIASGSLTISNNIVRLVKSSFKIWKTYILATSYKKENKKFLLKIMNSIINTAIKTNDTEDDHIWKTLVNNVQILIAQDEEDDESDDEDFMRFDYNISQSSRLKYRFSGFN